MRIVKAVNLASLKSPTATSLIRLPADIWQYIQGVRDSVCDLESRLQRAKDNIEEIQSCTRTWAVPVFDRREGKKDALLSLEDKAERLDGFYRLVRSSGEKIHFLLKVGRKRVLAFACQAFRVSSAFHHSKGVIM